MSAFPPSCTSQEPGVRLLRAWPTAASLLAAAYKERLLMAGAGFHTPPIQDTSHFLKPQGQYLVGWLWHPGRLQRVANTSRTQTILCPLGEGVGGRTSNLRAPKMMLNTCVLASSTCITLSEIIR